MKEHPLQQINNEVISADIIDTIVTLLENGLSTCTLTASDDRGINFLTKFKLYDEITVKFAYEEDNPNWQTIQPVFKGRIVEINPGLTVGGETLSITAIQGDALKQMRVAQDYGITGTAIIFDDPENPNMWTEYTATEVKNETFNVDLPVDNWTFEINEWTHVNNYPWLHPGDSDRITSFANEFPTDSYYHFQDLDPKYETIDEEDLVVYVKLRGRIRGTTVVHVFVKIYVYDGSDWVPAGGCFFTSTEWQNLNGGVDISGTFDTVSKINNARLKLCVEQFQGTEDTEIDISEAYLHVEGTGYWTEPKELCTIGSVEYIDSIPCPTNNTILFHKACCLHGGRGHVRIYYRWGNYGPWNEIGDPIVNCYACRCPGSANPNAPCGYPSNCTSPTDYVVGPLNTALQVKWRLEVSGTPPGCVTNCRIYYAYPDTLNVRRLETLREILCDDKLGIIPRFVEKVLNTDESSQYTINTDYVYNDATEYLYLNFPYQDAFMCIQDLVRYGTALRYIDNSSNWTGLHWIITPDSKLVIAPVGNHSVYGKDSNCFIESIWKTRVEKEPIVVREDMIVQNFKQEIPLANYVLVAGKLIVPDDEKWTESTTDWSSDSAPVANQAVISFDTSFKAVGTGSIRMHVEKPGGVNYITGLFLRYIGESLDFTKLVSRDNSIKFRFKYAMGGGVADASLVVATDVEHFVIYPLQGLVQDEFVECVIELDKDVITHINSRGDSYDKWTTKIKYFLGFLERTVDPPDWSNINFIGFIFRNANPFVLLIDCWVDDLLIEADLIRGAYTSDCRQTDIKNCKIGCIKHYGCRFLTIKDSLAHTTTMSKDDDTKPLPLLALYELLRHRIPKTTGQIQIPLDRTILPGQIVHIHACYDENTETYKIDGDFRIHEVRHSFNPRLVNTMLTLSDDLKNSIPINTFDPYTLIMRVMNPDYQTRTWASLKISGGQFSSLHKPISREYNT